jgi:hypothetical protein
MKQTVCRCVLALSVLGAVVLGIGNLFGIFQMSLLSPGEIDAFPAPRSWVIRRLLILLWPVGLYFSVLIVSRDVDWSRIRKFGAMIQVFYVFTLVWICFVSYNLQHSR